jgi:hypothetical protein
MLVGDAIDLDGAERITLDAHMYLHWDYSSGESTLPVVKRPAPGTPS